jgi:hypothetical protein
MRRGRPTSTTSRGTRTATGSAMTQIGVRLPRATMRILEAEAEAHRWPRSTFLELLVRHQLGEGLHLDRSPLAPKRYRFTDADWQETERWIWYVRPETKADLDRLRRRMGNIKPAAWIALTLNEWAGIAEGDHPIHK